MEYLFSWCITKSIDWAFQNEWRLLLPMAKKIKRLVNIVCQFFPITKVYLGNRMPPIKRKEIIDICNAKKYSLYWRLKENLMLFEMEDCAIKCEECFKYKNDLHK